MSLNREILILILQFLDEEKFSGTAQRLEQESRIFFNFKHFEKMAMNGDWEGVEKYLSAFTKVDDNRYSTKIFFEIRKQKYLEALDRKDHKKALDILLKELKDFTTFNEDVFKELTYLLTLNNIRENEQLSTYGDSKSERVIMLKEVKSLLEANPLFSEKLTLPTLKNSRLKILINQSLNWQHQLCKNPKPSPDMKTLFVDHSCGSSQPNGAYAAFPATRGPGFPPLVALGAHKLAHTSLPTTLPGWMTQAPKPHVMPPAGPTCSALQKRPRSPLAELENVPKRARPFVQPDEHPPMANIGVQIAQAGCSNVDLATPVHNADSGTPVHNVDSTIPIHDVDSANPEPNMPPTVDMPPTTSNIGVYNTQAGRSNVDSATPAYNADSATSVHNVDLTIPMHVVNSATPEPNVNSATSGPNIPLTVDMNGESHPPKDLTQKSEDESAERSQVWKLKEISEPSQCRSLRFPDNMPAPRVLRMMYTNSGGAILTLRDDAMHNLWKWQRNELNITGTATTILPPHRWQHPSGRVMANDVGDTKPQDAVSCFALTKNDAYVMSASGGKVSVFNMMNFKMVSLFTWSSPATFLAFHPADNNIVAIGMEDSTIQIYNVIADEVKSNLNGHQKRITGLAFSSILNVLISSGADSQLCVWGADGWEKQTCKYLDIQSDTSSDPPVDTTTPHTDTHIQLHPNQVHVLAVQESQLVVYEAPNLERVKQWLSNEASGHITYAVYSCDGQSIYASFKSGSVGVFTASSLQLSCLIKPSAYLLTNPSLEVYPLVVAAHPTEPNQFAVGLCDGGVLVLEPNQGEAQWGTPPLLEDGIEPSSPNGVAPV